MFVSLDAVGVSSFASLQIDIIFLVFSYFGYTCLDNHPFLVYLSLFTSLCQFIVFCFFPLCFVPASFPSAACTIGLVLIYANESLLLT